MYIEFEVNTIEWEHMKSRKYNCLVLMTKIYIQNNGYDGLALRYRSYL